MNEESDFTKREGTQSDMQDGMLSTVLIAECIWRVKRWVGMRVCVCAWEYKHEMTVNKEARKIMKGFNDKLASLYIDPLITGTVKTFK